MRIISQTFHFCPVCRAMHDSRKKAVSCRENCVRHAKANAAYNRLHLRIGNSFRLNVRSIATFERALIRHVFRTYNVELAFTKFELFKHLNKRATTHSAPVGEGTSWDHPSYYWGYNGWCEGSVKDLNKPQRKKGLHIMDLINEHAWHNDPIPHPIIGIRSGCMNGGSTTKAGANRFAGDLEIYLKDFPKLLEQFAKDRLVEDL